MPNERAILCGGLLPGRKNWPGGDPVVLRLSGSDPEVTLKIEQISESLAKNIPDRFLDLIELATYIYCADQAVSRGGSGVDVLGENWRRTLHFHVPVREPAFWRSAEVVSTLVETLGFLSDDEYHFKFEQLKKPPPLQRYFDFGGSNRQTIEDVALFSGGLDSLGGAVQEAIIDKRRVALVMHRSNEKLRKRHDHLLDLLNRKAAPFQPEHFPVSINKKKGLGRDYTQRSRSFLYACLASTFANLFHLDRIRFYENGVVSLNLPLSPQVVGAKATRTTHPRVLRGFARLFSLVSGKTFAVENPFIWKTKADVVQLIGDAGCGELITYSTSCTHTWEITNLHPHCGRCSQCIDRRFAVLAAGQTANDPVEGYNVELLLQPHEMGEDRTMLAAYAETAQRVARMNETAFLSEYGAVSRIVRHLPGSADAIGMKVFELYQRHAKGVCRVIKEAIAINSDRILSRELPDGCLVRLACDASGGGNGQVPHQATAPTPAPLVAIAQVSPLLQAVTDEYEFRRMGAAWVFRFAGREPQILLPSAGAAYLQLLLANPGKQMSAAELAYSVAKDPSRFALGDAGERNDKEAVETYRARYDELTTLLAEARANNDEKKIEDLQLEMGQLAAELKQSTWQGKRKKDCSDRERVRKRVSAAITRAVKQIAKYDALFAEHLQSPRLLLGLHPAYNPGEPLIWRL